MSSKKYFPNPNPSKEQYGVSANLERSQKIGDPIIFSELPQPAA